MAAGPVGVTHPAKTMFLMAFILAFLAWILNMIAVFVPWSWRDVAVYNRWWVISFGRIASGQPEILTPPMVDPEATYGIRDRFL